VKAGACLTSLAVMLYLAGLDNPAMRVKMLEMQPSSMDDALTIVCRLQAYQALNSLDKSAETNPAVEDRKHVRVVKPDKSVFFDTGADRDEAMERRFKQMEGDLAAQKRKLRQLSADTQQWKDRAITAEQKAQVFYPPPGHWFQPPVSFTVPQSYNMGYEQFPPPRNPGAMYQPNPADQFLPPPPAAFQQFRGRRQGNRRGGAAARVVNNDICHNCHERSHWARDCPTGAAADTPSVPPGFNVSEIQPIISESYFDMSLKVGTKTRTLPCLLDTGCDRCIMLRKYVRRQKLAPAEKSVLAASDNEIAILVSATLKFNLGGQELSANFFVTNGIDEIIFGFSFLRRYKCHWLFDEAVLVINGRKCALKNRPGRASVRCIYVRQSVSVPAGSSVNVPVKLPVPNLKSVSSDWVTETVELRPGLLVARTLLPDCDKYAAVPVVNVSGRDQILHSDLCIG